MMRNPVSKAKSSSQSEPNSFNSDRIDFSAANFKFILDKLNARYQSQWRNREFDENLLTKILSDFGFLKSSGKDNKTTILIAKLIENLTRLINFVAVRNKFRLLLQLLYNFENRSEFSDADFIAEIERMGGQMDPIEGVDLKQNLAELSSKIGELNRREKTAFFCDSG